MEKFFKLKENNTNVKTEIIAGITTFISMAYIIFVNPNILAGAGMNAQRLLGDAVGKAGLNAFNDQVIGSVFVATILSAIVGTLIMGLVANVPFAQAAGMGMNAFFTYYVVLKCGLSWEAALAVVFICGLINIFITVTKIRVAIVDAIPESLKNAIGAGIGLFIAILGFQSAGLVVADPATMIALGDVKSPTTLLSIFGIIITIILMVKNVKGAILLGIVLTTIAGSIAQLGFGVELNMIFPESFSVISAPPSLAPTLFKLDFKALFSAEVGLFSIIAIIISFSLVDTFDSIGTFIGTGAKTGIFDEKNDKPGKGMFPRKLDKALFADATATSIGALLGTSNVTTFVESAAGIGEGGRTGLTSVVTAVCFFLALFISPLVGIVPSQATAPALIIVGVLMISSITRIDFDNLEDGIPAFFTVAMMPFTASIANGIALGFIFYVLVKAAKGKTKEIHPIMIIFAILFILKFIMGV